MEAARASHEPTQLSFGSLLSTRAAAMSTAATTTSCSKCSMRYNVFDDLKQHSTTQPTTALLAETGRKMSNAFIACNAGSAWLTATATVEMSLLKLGEMDVNVAPKNEWLETSCSRGQKCGDCSAVCIIEYTAAHTTASGRNFHICVVALGLMPTCIHITTNNFLKDLISSGPPLFLCVGKVLFWNQVSDRYENSHFAQAMAKQHLTTAATHKSQRVCICTKNCQYFRLRNATQSGARYIPQDQVGYRSPVDGIVEGVVCGYRKSHGL